MAINANEVSHAADDGSWNGSETFYSNYFQAASFRDQSLLMVGGGAEDIKGGSPIIFLPRWGGQIKNQTARGGAMKNNQLKLTSILFRNK